MARRRRFYRRQQRRPSLTTGIGTLAGTLATLAGGWLIYSAAVIDHQMPLPKAVQADREMMFSDSAGRLSYYADRSGSGRPVVLIHSINAAASAYEMSPLFNHYRGKRPVYALDLPGYGFSERSPRVYSPELFTAAILDFLSDQVRTEADVVALSLSSEFAARAAVERPDLFHSLTMISPTGMSMKEKTGGSSSAYQALSFPLWGQGIYDGLVTEISIRAFLQRSFTGPVPNEMVQYAYATSHQPGARNAPFHFLSGLLFTPQVYEQYYLRLSVPTLVLYDRDGFTSFEWLPRLVQVNPQVQAVRIVNTLGLPHWEKLEETAAALERHWEAVQV